MLKYYEFRLLPDFSNNQGPGVLAQTRIQDAYLNVHYWDCFQVEAGKFKQPISYEQLIQDRFVPTLERSMIDQLVPARDEGIMIHGQKLLGDKLDYAIAVSNGEINGDFDTNKLKDGNGRIVVRPLNWDGALPLLRGLQVGVSGGTGVEQESVNPNILRTPATVQWLKFNSNTVANGRRDRVTPEVSYFYGPLGFAAQYYWEDQHLSPATVPAPGSTTVLEVPFKGYYFLTTLLLTGEERTTYSAPIAPLRPFDVCHPFAYPGAWELVARVSQLRVGDEVFEPIRTGRTTFVALASPLGNSDRATELTLGFNWYLNEWVRVQFNWEHAWFAQPVRLGPGPDGLLRHQDSLLTRFQIIF
jgi:phosphate-selective porin OprO/OprP